MVNEKPKKVEKKSAGRAERPIRKTTSKKKSDILKRETSVQEKTGSVKKAAISAKEKKPVARKVTKQPGAKSKAKVSAVKKTKTEKVQKVSTKKKPVKKAQKKVTAKQNTELKIKQADKKQVEKVENVIEKLSQKPEQRYITTVPGILRKVPAGKKKAPEVHKELPITAILNYLKKMF